MTSTDRGRKRGMSVFFRCFSCSFFLIRYHTHATETYFKVLHVHRSHSSHSSYSIPTSFMMKCLLKCFAVALVTLTNSFVSSKVCSLIIEVLSSIYIFFAVLTIRMDEVMGNEWTNSLFKASVLLLNYTFSLVVAPCSCCCNRWTIHPPIYHFINLSVHSRSAAFVASISIVHEKISFSWW